MKAPNLRKKFLISPSGSVRLLKSNSTVRVRNPFVTAQGRNSHNFLRPLFRGKLTRVVFSCSSTFRFYYRGVLFFAYLLACLFVCLYRRVISAVYKTKSYRFEFRNVMRFAMIFCETALEILGYLLF
jgi:hypothetical protein